MLRSPNFTYLLLLLTGACSVTKQYSYWTQTTASCCGICSALYCTLNLEYTVLPNSAFWFGCKSCNRRILVCSRTSFNLGKDVEFAFTLLVSTILPKANIISHVYDVPYMLLWHACKPYGFVQPQTAIPTVCVAAARSGCII